MHPFSYNVGALWRGEVCRRMNEAQLTAAARSDPVWGRTAAVLSGRPVAARWWWAIRPLRRCQGEQNRVVQD